MRADPEDSDSDLFEARGGQLNGLCGAVFPGVLSMMVGLRSQQVPFSLQIEHTAPELAEDREDVVDVSFTLPTWRSL